MHVIAAKAVCFHEALQPSFNDYQRQIVLNSRVLAETLLEAGFDLVTGGTDNHIVLLDLTKQGITGLDAENALSDVGIVTNKNAVPFDKRGPKVTSGLRLGTPAITTRGIKEQEMKVIAGMIVDVLSDPKDKAVFNRVKSGIKELCEAFPIYEDLREV